MMASFFRLFYWTGCFLFLFVLGCKPKKKTQSQQETVLQNWNETIQGSFSDQQQLTFDSTALRNFLHQYPVFEAYRTELETFYRDRRFAFAWFEGETLIEPAGNLLNRIAHLPEEGIHQLIPYQGQTDSLRHLQPASFESNLQLELLLTAQYFMFAQFVWEGMDQSFSEKAKWYLPRKKIAYERYLDSLLKNTDGPLSPEEPVYRQYLLLKTHLRKYQEWAQEGNWEIFHSKKTLREGDSATWIPRLKKRLARMTDFRGDTTSKQFDAALKEGLKSFQERHGLAIHGRVDQATLAELNVSPTRRVEQLIVNMERSRWLPIRMEGRYLGVNIPEFKLHVYHSDSLLWSTPVVVGKSMHQTTVFYGQIQYLVFSPYWNVPSSIVRQEFIPSMQKDPSFLSRNRIEVTGYRSQGEPIMRQLPGPQNSLGLVKFMFPNRYDIYLHDTPSKSLFDAQSRAFSHGCIRVSDPAKLAAFLLSDKPEWGETSIRNAMHAGKEQYVNLKEKVPVFIAYFTAFIDREERLHFREDIYGLDQKLAKGLIDRINP